MFDFTDLQALAANRNSVVFVELTREQWSFLWLLATLGSEATWWDVVDEDMDTWQGVVDGAIQALLMGGSGVSFLSNHRIYSGRVLGASDDAGGLALSFNTSDIDRCAVYPATPANGTTAVVITDYFPAGQHTIATEYRQGSGAGKYRWRVNGEFQSSCLEFDLYAAAATYNNWQRDYVTFETDGIQTLALECTGKRAASSGYNCNINSVAFWFGV